MDIKIPACSSHLLDPVSVSSNSPDSANCKSDLWMAEFADAEPMDMENQSYAKMLQMVQITANCYFLLLAYLYFCNKHASFW